MQKPSRPHCGKYLEVSFGSRARSRRVLDSWHHSASYGIPYLLSTTFLIAIHGISESHHSSLYQIPIELKAISHIGSPLNFYVTTHSPSSNPHSIDIESSIKSTNNGSPIVQSVSSNVETLCNNGAAFVQT